MAVAGRGTSNGGAQPYGHLFDDEDEAPAPPVQRSPDLDKLLADAKALGNGLFQEGRYDDAWAAYKHGLDIFEQETKGRTGRLSKHFVIPEVHKLASALYCNSAQVLLKCAGPKRSCAGRSLQMAERALGLEPSNVKAIFRRGCAHAFGEDWGSAAKDFERALELEPGSDAARRELEKVQDKMRESGSGLAEQSPDTIDMEKLEDVIAGAEDDKAKGTRLFQEERYWQAYEAWQHASVALEAFPAGALHAPAQKLLVALYNNSAQALLQCSEVEGATTELAAAMANKTLQLEPSNIKALFRRGVARTNGELWQLASQDFEHVLELEPGNVAAQEELQRMQETAPEEVFAPKVPPQVSVNKADLTDPDVVTKMAQKEAERFRREILVAADGNGTAPKWCHRFNKMQVQGAAWAKHQLSDADGVEDLVTLHGPVFAAMTEQQKLDFICACEFMNDMRGQYGDEIDVLYQHR
mmetsp:Transcript_26550/g.76452  ORF Transcript_26550/g.76452 Transcript_26550/m.76452 type:complete len:469 (+) Transcript_26550:59-1465(+)